TLSSRLSESSSWTSDSDGLVCSFDIATQARLKFTQPEGLHLATQVARLDRQTPDALVGFVREAVELSRIDQQADRELLAVLLEHVLVAGDGASRDLHLGEAADPPFEHV